MAKPLFCNLWILGWFWVQPWLTLLAEAITFSSSICWFLMEARVSWFNSPTAWPPYFTVGTRCFSIWLSFLQRHTHLWCMLPWSSIFVLVWPCSIENPSSVWETVYVLACVYRWQSFFLLPSQTACVCVGAMWWWLGRPQRFSWSLESSSCIPWRIFCQSNHSPHSVWSQVADTSSSTLSFTMSSLFKLLATAARYVQLYSFLHASLLWSLVFPILKNVKGN